MKTRRKSLLKWIRKDVVPHLPPATYKAYHKYNGPKMEKDEEGKEVLRFGYLQDHPVNHGRRLKRIYDRVGYSGIVGYLASYGLKLSESPAN